MPRSSAIAFAATALACAGAPMADVRDSNTSSPAGLWQLIVRDGPDRHLTATVLLSDDSASIGHYSIRGIQSVDQCLPSSGQVFGWVRRDSIMLWLNPMHSHCGLRLYGVREGDAAHGEWCTESWAPPTCGTDERAMRGTFALRR
jgi:hypothetical protein